MFALAIYDAVDKVEAILPTLGEAELASLEEGCTLDFDEWFAIGPMFSLASSAGIIDLDFAAILHGWHTDFNNDLSLAKRCVMMQAVGQLIPALKAEGLL